MAAGGPARADALGAALARARGISRLRGLVVARDGELLAAEALGGPGLERPVNVKSLSKTVLALMTGIAIDRGLLPDEDVSLGAIMGRAIPRSADPAVRDIRIHDLLTMRAGLERTSGPNYGRWVASRDWLDYALTRPTVAAPGGPMLYSTGSYHILGAALAYAAGRDLRALAQDWLGTPLGFKVPAWTQDPQGRYLGGNNMAISAMSLMRIGEVVRTGGLWGERRVVSARWVRESLTARTVSPWSGDAYGYGWFLRNGDESGRAYGRGYGGQLLYVAPAEAATIVLLSDPTRPARSGGYIDELHALVADALLPALSA